MIKKIVEKLKKTEEEKHLIKLEKFRENHIPEQYNQIKMMEFLLDDEVDHYVSISNRSDGKSINYTNYTIKFCIDEGLGFTLVMRHYTVRKAGQKLIQKVIDTFEDIYNPRDFHFMSTDFYIVVIYKDRHIGIITDLNAATDLKYQSNYIVDFPIIIYDEFLAIKGDYLIDEWERLRTIYGSINRGVEYPKIKIPKILYLGNAVNFSSPVLANLDIFNILEQHQMGTIRKYGNIVLELNRNEHANDNRNLRAFKEEDDHLTMGEFEINNYNLATPDDRNRINKKPSYIYIKDRDFYIKITYNMNTFESIISVISFTKNYDYNILLKDNIETSVFLSETFYDIDHERKYNKGVYLFDNNYSKDTIVDNYNDLKMLRIDKIIRHHFSNNKMDNFEIREKTYKENYIENTKRSLYNRFFNRHGI